MVNDFLNVSTKLLSKDCIQVAMAMYRVSQKAETSLVFFSHLKHICNLNGISLN